MKRTIIFILIAFAINAGMMAEAQDLRYVSGMVTTYGNIPLNKVKVTAARSGEGALTDIEGRFVIAAGNRDVLTFSASGFRDKKVKIKRDNTVLTDLTFVEKSENIEAAVRNGHISEESLLKALNTTPLLTARDYTKYKSIYDLVASEFYNLRVKGEEVVNTKIRSFDHSPNVLLVVDDRIVTSIDFVDPEYVKHIEFIDDVRATVYGVSGANGVLKITLK